MTDKELLELAAKAAGNPQGTSYASGGLLMANDLYWNPLTDDGDALRLVVKLNLCVDVDRRKIEVLWSDKIGNVQTVDEKGSKSGEDPYAATRRAVVRCAAEIGKEMK